MDARHPGTQEVEVGYEEKGLTGEGTGQPRTYEEGGGGWAQGEKWDGTEGGMGGMVVNKQDGR